MSIAVLEYENKSLFMSLKVPGLFLTFLGKFWYQRNWEKKSLILGKNCAIFCKIGKVYLLNWDFSANWECFRSIGNFFSQLGKNLEYRKPDPVLYREKALSTKATRLTDTDNQVVYGTYGI